MASLDTLPSDQRAVLELVVRRGRTYEQIEAMLGIDRAGVRERALAAFDSLGPETSVSPERRALIADYLLGALSPRVADEVRSLLASSAPERAWARVIAAELQPVAKTPLPEIPGDTGRAQPREAAPPQAPRPAPPAEAPSDPLRGPAPRREPGRAPEPAQPVPPTAARPRPAPRPPAVPPPVPPVRPSSRRGGAVLLGIGSLLAVAVVVVLIVVLTNNGSSTPTSRLARHPVAPTTTPAPTSTTGAQVLAQINLNPPSGGAAKGIAVLLRVSGRVGIEIRAAGLAPNSLHPPNAYAVWLYNSPTDSRLLGFVNPGVGKNGQLQTAGGLPSNASRYQKLLITLETQSSPKTPGTIMLQGALTGLS